MMLHARTSHDTRQLANRNQTVTTTHTHTSHHAHTCGNRTLEQEGEGKSCSACKKAATDGPNLNVRLYCHEHDGVNTGGHDQVTRAAISN